MITIENVTRNYGDFTAVDQVSFTISSGEIVGLLGHNGAGKTTIMKMLTGFLEPTAGTITIDGKKIAQDRQDIQKDIGYLPENCPLYSEMSVVDYLHYAASLHGVDKGERDGMVVEAVQKTALHEKAHQPISTLSRGYKQRTGVAQAILHKPKILILDEPTNGLDPTQILQMRDLIRTLAKQSTVIISTHILQEVQAVCDRVIIMNNGKMALDTRLHSLQDGSRLMVEVDAPVDSVSPRLTGVAGVSKIDPVGSPAGNSLRYGLHLTKESSKQDVAAAVAKEVHSAGWSLYSLQYETRDLESVFAEISTQ